MKTKVIKVEGIFNRYNYMSCVGIAFILLQFTEFQFISANTELYVAIFQIFSSISFLISLQLLGKLLEEDLFLEPRLRYIIEVEQSFIVLIVIKIVSVIIIFMMTLLSLGTFTSLLPLLPYNATLFNISVICYIAIQKDDIGLTETQLMLFKLFILSVSILYIWYIYDIIAGL